MRKLSKRLIRGSGELYGAKLLFQWRVIERNTTKRKRLCEERIILLRARSSREALAAARRYGRAGSYRDPSSRAGVRDVFFDFIGVVDLDRVFADFTEHPTEVWYEFHERLRPMERRQRLLVPERRMRAFGGRKLPPGAVRVFG